MRKLTATLTLLFAGATAPAYAGGPSGFPSALPPVANPGECYAQVRIPAQYSTGSQTVVKKDAYAKLKVTEPQLRARQETVMTKEPSVQYRVRQPSYRTISEKILTRPAYDKLSVSAPQFSTVTERFQTGAPHLVWKRGNPAELQRQGYVIHSTADGRLRDSSGYRGGSYATTQSGGDACGPGCEIWCLVEEPGTSVTTTRRVMSAPSRVIRTPVPAQHRTITKQVLADPGGVEEIPIPAEYTNVMVEDLVRPAEAYEVNVPAEYGDVQTKQLISPERYEWRRVLCQPGTSVRSNSTYSSGSHSAPSHSSTTYSAPSHRSHSTYEVPSGTAYSSPETSPSPRSGYYGTEEYPAYQRRVPHRKRK